MRFWLVGLALAGCAGEAELGSTRRAIVSGEVALEDQAVVAVYLGWDDGTDRLCTGTLVSPRVVLTAGHCLRDADTATRFDVGFGTDVREVPEFDAVTWAGAVGHMVDPDLSFDSPTEGHDVGLVLLDAPSAVPWVPMGSWPPPEGASVRAVGYGRTDRDVSDAGVRRDVMAPVTRVESRLFYFGNYDSNTCLGDSGGPVLYEVDGLESLVGTSSFGDSRCRSTTGATRVDEYLYDLIYPWISEHDPDAPEPPPEPPEMDGGGCAVAPGGGRPASWTLGLLAALVAVLQQVGRLFPPVRSRRRHLPPHRVG
jgi:secreted trypsin-like serine protease